MEYCEKVLMASFIWKMLLAKLLHAVLYGSMKMFLLSGKLISSYMSTITTKWKIVQGNLMKTSIAKIEVVLPKLWRLAFNGGRGQSFVHLGIAEWVKDWEYLGIT